MNREQKAKVKEVGYYMLDYSISCIYCENKTKFSDGICLDCDEEVPNHIPEEQLTEYRVKRRKKYGKHSCK